MSKFYQITGTISNPITLEMAKRQLVIDPLADHDDTLIGEIVDEAFKLAEDYTERYLASRDLIIYSTDFFTSIEDDFAPLGGVSKIEYLDDDGITYIELNTAFYDVVSLDQSRQRILYKIEELPGLITDDRAVKATATVGYTATTLPKSIRSGIKLLISFLYENRDDRVDQKTRASQNILRPYRNF